MTRNAILTVLVVLGLVAGSVPAAAVLLPGTVPAVGGGAQAGVSAAAGEHAVDVEVGQQLSTVMSVTDEDTRSDVDRTAFQVAVAEANESTRVALIAEREDALLERTEEILDAYREVSEAFQEGELTRSEYAHQLALLNARARSVLGAVERLQAAAGNVSALELRAAGYDRAALTAAVAELGVVTGVGSSALLEKFTGESEGAVSLETEDGLSIAVESDDGVRSRELQRPLDNDTGFTVTQTEALETARGALSSTEGTWVLEDTEIHVEHGAYHFEFRLVGAEAEGEAMVAVDGSSGELHHLAEEVRTAEAAGEGDDAGTEGTDADADDTDADEDADDTDADDAEGADSVTADDADGLTLLLVRGLPAPGERVTLTVLDAGQPVGGATVHLNGEVVGTTGADGTVTLTLPGGEDADIRVAAGDRAGDLELEFGDDEPETLVRNLDATGSVANGTARIRVTYDGSGVEGVDVYRAGTLVGTTDDRGVVSFPVSAAGDIEVRLVKGAFAATLELSESDGSLTLSSVDVEDVEDDDDADDDDTDGDGADSDGTDGDSDSDGDGTDSDGTDGDSDSDGDSADSDGTATDSDGDGDSTDSDTSDADTSDGDSTATETSGTATESDGDTDETTTEVDGDDEEG